MLDDGCDQQCGQWFGQLVQLVCIVFYFGVDDCCDCCDQDQYIVQVWVYCGFYSLVRWLGLLLMCFSDGYFRLLWQFSIMLLMWFMCLISNVSGVLLVCVVVIVFLSVWLLNMWLFRFSMVMFGVRLVLNVGLFYSMLLMQLVLLIDMLIEYSRLLVLVWDFCVLNVLLGVLVQISFQLVVFSLLVSGLWLFRCLCRKVVQLKGVMLFKVVIMLLKVYGWMFQLLLFMLKNVLVKLFSLCWLLVSVCSLFFMFSYIIWLLEQ